MDLKATKILKAVLENGFVPSTIVAYGQHDEGAGAPAVRMTVAKTANPGHVRSLSCSFELPTKYKEGTDPVAGAIRELVGMRTGAKPVASGPLKVGNLDAQHAEVHHISAADKVQFALHVIALQHGGLVHRYALSIIKEKSAEGLEVLKKFIGEALAE